MTNNHRVTSAAVWGHALGEYSLSIMSSAILEACNTNPISKNNVVDACQHVLHVYQFLPVLLHQFNTVIVKS